MDEISSITDTTISSNAGFESNYDEAADEANSNTNADYDDEDDEEEEDEEDDEGEDGEEGEADHEAKS